MTKALSHAAGKRSLSRGRVNMSNLIKPMHREM